MILVDFFTLRRPVNLARRSHDHPFNARIHRRLQHIQRAYVIGVDYFKGMLEGIVDERYGGEVHYYFRFGLDDLGHCVLLTNMACYEFYFAHRLAEIRQVRLASREVGLCEHCDVRIEGNELIHQMAAYESLSPCHHDLLSFPK